MPLTRKELEDLYSSGWGSYNPDMGTSIDTQAQANQAKQKSKGFGWDDVGDFFQGLGAGVVKGAEGVVGSGARAVDSLFVGDGENAVTKWADKAQKDTDKWTKEHADSAAGKVGNFVGDLPGGIVSGVADAGSTVVRGIEALPEGIAADIAASSSDPYLRKEGIKEQSDLAKRISGGKTNDIVKAGTGAVLADAETIVNLIAAGKGGAVFDGGKALITNLGKKGAFDAIKQAVKDSGKEVSDSAIKNFIKTSAKSGTENAALNTPIQVAQQVNDTGKTSAGDVARDVATNAAFGIVGGRTGRSELNAKAGNEFAEQMDSAANSRQAAARLEEEQKAAQAKVDAENTTVDNLEKEANQAHEDDYKKQFYQEMAARDLGISDGTGNTPKGQLLLTAGERDDHARTVLAVSRELKNVQNGTGKYANATAEQRKTAFARLNKELEQAKANHETTDFVVNRDANTNSNIPEAVTEAKAQSLHEGNIPDDLMQPAQAPSNVADIVGNPSLPEDVRNQASTLLEHQNIINSRLDNLMTKKQADIQHQKMDAAYKKQEEAISQMPAPRQEVELEKLNERYQNDLDELNSQVQNDAPEVERLSMIQDHLNNKEQNILGSVSEAMRAEPDKYRVPDDVKVSETIDNLRHAKELDTLTENSSSVSTPQIKSVENGILPSDSTNPVVIKAADDTTGAAYNIKEAEGTNPTFLDWWTGMPREVLQKFGAPGRRVARILDKAVDEVAIADNKTALQIRDWKRAAKDGKTMPTIAKALDGDMNAYNSLSDSQKEIANQIRDFLRDYADKLGLEPGQRVENYLPHIFDDKPASAIDKALAELTAGKTVDGKTLTADMRAERNQIIRGVDYEALEMIRRNSAYKVKNGFLKHRTGKEGYSFDLPDILVTYAHAAHNTIHLKPAFSEVKGASEYMNAEQNKYLAEVVRSVGGRPTDELGQQLNNQLESILPTSSAYSTYSSKVRKLIYDGTMGFNVRSAIQNLGQGANTYAHLGEKYYPIGMAKAVQSFKHSNGMYDELVEHGVLTNRFSDELRNGGNAEHTKLNNAMWGMFRGVEQLNRAAAYFGAKQRYIDKYIKSEAKKGNVISEKDIPEDVLKSAQTAGRRMSAKTQFEFGKLDQPIKQQTATAKNFLQLQGYNIAQVRLIKNMIAGSDGMFKKAPNGKYHLSGVGALRLARLFGANALFVGTVGSIYGATMGNTIPFGENIKDIWDGNIGQAVPRSPVTQLLIGSGGDGGATGLIPVLSEGVGAAHGKVEGGQFVQDLQGYGKDVSRLLIPGGGQIGKTFDAANTNAKGFSENANGSIRFAQNNDTPSRIQSLLFGQYSTKNGQDWIKEGFPTLSPEQTKKVYSQPDDETKQQYAEFYQAMEHSSGRQSAFDAAQAALSDHKPNKAKRLVDEYNNKINESLQGYAAKYGGNLPNELQDVLDRKYIKFNNVEDN